MSMLAAILLAVSCAVTGHVGEGCQPAPTAASTPVQQAAKAPRRSADALDVVLTAKAAVAWDTASGATLYAKSPNERRQVASLSKLLSALVVVETLAPETVVAIPPAAEQAQRLGAHIRLPAGEHASVDALLAASLIPSANDAIVSLAVASADSEEAFVERANAATARLGLHNTKLANATGLPGGEQYSTANDVKRLLTLVYEQPTLGHYLDDAAGTLMTAEGTRRSYKTTNDLLATYLPVLAAKTGYTREAGENVALLTRLPSQHTIGIVILGSEQRFQDAKVLAEWISRHYAWPY